MVQKHSRFILTIIGCLLLITALGATTLTQTTDAPWLQSVTNKLPFVSDGDAVQGPQPSLRQSSTPTYHYYAALGDSVAAGSGLRLLAGASVTDSQCARSSESFPVILARKLQTKFTFAACGGATTSHLLRPQVLSTVSNPPQLNIAYRAGRPDLITITLGANDMRWIQTINDCFDSDCNTTDKTTAIDDALSDFKMKLYYDLHDIEQRSQGKKPKIILTGYYSMGTPTCLTSQYPDSFTRAEAVWLDAQTSKMNTIIRSMTSQFPNTSYIALDTRTHGLCAAGDGRWVQGPTDPALFHLTAAGEQAFADAIYKQIR